MRGEGLDRTLSWSEIRSYAEQIEQQLAETPAAAAPQTARALPNKSPLPLVLGIAAVVALVGIGAMMMSGKNGGKAALPLPGPVEVAAGEHPGPDGSRHTLPAFSLAGHEVTIGEYQDFLEALDRLHWVHPVANWAGHETRGVTIMKSVRSRSLRKRLSFSISSSCELPAHSTGPK